MKKALKTVGLLLVLSLALVGCKKESPEDVAKKVQDQIANAKYMDTNLDASINTKNDNQEVKLTMNGKLQYDISGELPVLLYDGKMGMSGLDLSFIFYLDQENMTMSFMGQTQTETLPEDYKNAIKEAMQKQKENKAQADGLKYTPTLEKKGSEQVLTLNYDTNALNDYLKQALSGEAASLTGDVNTTDTVIEKMQVVYTLDGKNTVKSCQAIMDMKIGGDTANIVATLTVNSIDQKLDIQAPSTNNTNAAA